MLPLRGPLAFCNSFGLLEHQASSVLSRLDGMMEASAKPDMFWLTWLLKEAQHANEIEGTVTTFEEILGEKAGIVVPAQRKDDVREVLNYHETMLSGIAALKDGRHLSLSLIKTLHAFLLQGTRGDNRNPGQYRQGQVHIGRPRTPVEDALYIPPEAVHVPALLENWMEFMAREDLNPIIQVGIMHAQFEMIHPFLDGNGRLGRLLITLFLFEKSVLSIPCFYVSAYLQEHRREYYDALQKISHNNDWNTWIQFFLNVVISRSNANIIILKKMNVLYESSKDIFRKITGSTYSIQILDYFFSKPIFTIPDMLQETDINLSQQGATQILNKLEHAGILRKAEKRRGRIPSVWHFVPLLAILQ